MMQYRWTFSILLFVGSIFLAGCSDAGLRGDEELWPEIEPFQTDYLKVSDIHEIYYDLSGNPKGMPVFVIHGGPGSGSSPKMRRFFNPEKFLIVLHDQRGAGKSRPYAEIRENTTQYLIEDIERLRKHLKLAQIVVFGGSWGSTLGLAYAETYPESVRGMILRGVWTATKEEDDHYYNGVPKFFPEVYDSYINALPDSATPPLPNNLLKLIQSENLSTREKYSKIISRYEDKFSYHFISDKDLDDYYKSENAFTESYPFVLFENYYVANGCFLEDGQLLRDAYKIKEIPTVIVNGRYDMVCPPIFAYRLHKLLPKSKLIIAEAAGHSMYDKPIQRELLKVMRDFE